LATATHSIDGEEALAEKLPLSEGLKPELERSGRLVLRTTTAGELRLRGSGPEDVSKYGACAEATHLLTAMSVGSFELSSEAETSAPVESHLGGAGPNGDSARNILHEAGSRESCSEVGEDTPHVDCSAPLRAILVPLTGRSGGKSMRVTFSSGNPNFRWKVRAGHEEVCQTPCTAWLDASKLYRMKSIETPGGSQTIDLGELSNLSATGEARVVAHFGDKRRESNGHELVAIGGMTAGIGGFLTLFGGASDTLPLALTGVGAVAGGAAMIVPGILKARKNSAYAEISVIASSRPPGD
jgi:hypothetical protein